MNQETDKSASVEEDVSNIVIELYDAITLFNENNNLKSYLDNYTKSVTRIGFRIGKARYDALRDSCVIFHDIINDLNKRKDTVTTSQLEQLEIWPTLILAYIGNPTDEDNIELLVSFLKSEIWGYNANEGAFTELNNNFNNTIHPSVTSTNESDEIDDSASNLSNAFDGALFESVQEEVIETMTGLISDLSSTDDDDDFGLGHAFSLCADRIELLGMSIAASGLVGLMDVCVIFQSGLRQLAQREKPLSDEEQVIIEEWTSHFIAYLSSPTDPDIVDHLVDYLNGMPWSDPMSEEEMMTLRFMLVPEDIEVTAPIESEDVSLEYENAKQTDEGLEYEIDNTEELDEISFSEENYTLGNELVQLIRDEFQLEQISLDEAIQNISANTPLKDNDVDQLSTFKLMVERFSLATESIGLIGLNKLLVHIVENLDITINKSSQLDGVMVSALKQFSTMSLNYLNDMENKEQINEFVTPYFSKIWPKPFDFDQSSLEQELYSPQLLIEDDIEIRATQAAPEDISLKLPEDVNQELLNTLLQELPIQTEEFTQSITQLVEGNATLKDVEKAQRIAHTLKGAANTVGIVGIATLTHHIEDIFDAFTTQQRLPGKSLADILMNAADVLETMSESLLGIGDEPEQAQSVLQQILNWANLIDQEGIPEDDAQIQINKNSNDDETVSQEDNSHLNDVIAPTMLRVPATLMDELLRIAGESIILGGQLQERLRKATEQTEFVHAQNTLYQQLVFELEQIVDVQGLTGKKTTSTENDVFDSLELEQYNELHTVTHRLVEAATDSKELTHNIEDELNNLDTLLVDQSRLHKQNQNIVMQTRMVPVKNIVPRLQRSIRQTSRTTGKKVSLEVDGTETLMDSDVLNELVDPLMHILRNSVDHGIENEPERIKSNKDIMGTINLIFSRDGDHIVVKCKDDGAGLDYEAIRRIAIKKELIGNNQELSNEELIRLIWLAGFTTRDTTTQVSGRGIGMDAVYNQVTSMKGTINITSEKNKGCVVEIRLPLTLISVHAILIKLRKQTVAISNRGIEQILCPGDGDLKRDNESYTYHLNDEVYTAFDIETLLHQPRDQRNNDREDRTIFILKDETGYKYAITVEQVLANQDLIVKQLGTYIPDILGIEGATILGDGSVAPVLDLPGLIRTISKNDINQDIEHRLAKAEPIEENLTALVVDDSLSARRSLAEFIKDLGYDVRMARDGIEAIEVIETKKPDIILVDLEMPRMNGLELTSHIRSKKDIKDIPIIMITSRSTEKHREMADSAGVNSYLTKPFSEEQLLENIQSLLLAVN